MGRGRQRRPLFLSCRAAVRAKTSATAARLQADAARSRELENVAREYLEMAIGLLQPEPPRLIAIGSLSGSGKSTVALALAPIVGAIALQAGRTVIVDAVLPRPADRAAIEAVAASTSVPFAGFWLDAPMDALLARTARRRLDPSDADASVAQQQIAAGIGSLSWRRIDAGHPYEEALADTLAVLSEPPFRTRAHATHR